MLLALASVAAALFYFQCSARRLEAISQAAKTSFKGSEVSVESPPLGLSHLQRQGTCVFCRGPGRRQRAGSL